MALNRLRGIGQVTRRDQGIHLVSGRTTVRGCVVETTKLRDHSYSIDTLTQHGREESRDAVKIVEPRQ